jgi:hypothetical protein
MLGFSGTSRQLRSLIEAGYRGVEQSQWYSWTRPSYLETENKAKLRYKLYVSPAPHAVVDVVERAVKVAVQLEAPSFKIGTSIGSLLRPDKFILYTDSDQALHLLASELKRELAGYPAQGVPFTKPLDTTGMLSASLEPPRSFCLPGWEHAESWRAWITDRLAVALVQARSFSRDPAIQCEFALSKLYIDGIDTHEWTATSRLWQGQ